MHRVEVRLLHVVVPSLDRIEVIHHARTQAVLTLTRLKRVLHLALSGYLAVAHGQHVLVVRMQLELAFRLIIPSLRSLIRKKLLFVVNLDNVAVVLLSVHVPRGLLTTHVQRVASATVPLAQPWSCLNACTAAKVAYFRITRTLVSWHELLMVDDHAAHVCHNLILNVDVRVLVRRRATHLLALLDGRRDVVRHCMRRRRQTRYQFIGLLVERDRFNCTRLRQQEGRADLLALLSRAREEFVMIVLVWLHLDCAARHLG